MNNGGVEAVLTCLVEEHAVQNLTGCWAETKAHIGETQRGERTWNLSFYALDCFEGCDAVFTKIFIAGSDGEGECIKDEVTVGEAVTLCCDFCNAMGDFHLPFDITSLTTFVNQQTNHCSTKISGQGEDAIKAAAGLFAIFQVGGVQNAATTGVQKTCFHHLGFGGVENQRHTSLAGETGCNLVHVDCAVVTDIVNAHVKNVGALSNLLSCHLEAGVPVFAQHCFTECF